MAPRLISLYVMALTILLDVGTSAAQTKTEAPSQDEDIALSKLFRPFIPLWLGRRESQGPSKYASTFDQTEALRRRRSS